LPSFRLSSRGSRCRLWQKDLQVRNASRPGKSAAPPSTRRNRTRPRITSSIRVLWRMSVKGQGRRSAPRQSWSAAEGGADAIFWKADHRPEISVGPRQRLCRDEASSRIFQQVGRIIVENSARMILWSEACSKSWPNAPEQPVHASVSGSTFRSAECEGF
jgi:hypothetical protein